MSDLISRQAAIDLMQVALEDSWEPDYATDRMNELPSVQPDPCDVCAHTDDCGDMRIYCPAERRTDEQT